MKLRNLIIAGLTAFQACTLEAGFLDQMTQYFTSEEQAVDHTLRILLVDQADGAMLQVTGPYNIYDPRTGSRLGTRFMGKNMFVQPLEQGLKWGERFPEIYQFQVVPDREEVTTLVNGVQYKGKVTVYNVAGKVSIVNEVKVEDFVRSKLSVEFPRPVDPEVLSAVAIVARTDAYYWSKHGKSRFWDVTAQEANYKGEAPAYRRSGIEQAVEQTEGLAMTYRPAYGKPSPFAASWTEHSAGHTVPYHLIFHREGAGPVEGVHTGEALKDRETTHWESSVNLGELVQAVGLKKLTNFRLFVDDESQKVYRVRFQDGKHIVDWDFSTFQEKFGKNVVCSSQFSMELKGDQLKLQGWGKGHGSGLCLYSARKLAQRGENAAEILAHFFPGAVIELRPEHNVVTEVDQVAEEPPSTRKKGKRHPSLR